MSGTETASRTFVRLLPRFTIVEWLVLLVIGGMLSTFLLEELGGRLGSRDGVKDAETDIAAGSLKLKFAGKPPYYREQMKAIFRERYGVTLEYIGGCCPSSYRRNYNAAYNDQMQKAAVLRFPDFAIDTVYASVREEAKRRRDAGRNTRQSRPQQTLYGQCQPMSPTVKGSTRQ
jgi:hypothetical protein